MATSKDIHFPFWTTPQIVLWSKYSSLGPNEAASHLSLFHTNTINSWYSIYMCSVYFFTMHMSDRYENSIPVALCIIDVHTHTHTQLHPHTYRHRCVSFSLSTSPPFLPLSTTVGSHHCTVFSSCCAIVCCHCNILCCIL